MSENKFQSPLGFILASVGSAVGLANIWAFPIRVGHNGGAVFIILYLLFVALFAWVGLSAEFATGRRCREGILGCFSTTWKDRGRERTGFVLGWLPWLTTIAITAGYAVIVAWVARSFGGVLAGAVCAQGQGVEEARAFFSAAADTHFGSWTWCLAVFVATVAAVFYGAASIEKTNLVMMPAFFILFVLLALRVAFLPGVGEGYLHIFTPQWEYLFLPSTWLAAMGQALFSLTLFASSLLVYGSYLEKDEDVVSSALYVAGFDTLAALCAALVIIPAGAAFGVNYTSGGPELMFVVLPGIFNQIPLGQLLAGFFFLSVFFAGFSSLQGLFEAAAEPFISRFGMTRKRVVIVLGSVLFLLGLLTEKSSVLMPWMDLVSLYATPLSALLGAISWYWVQNGETLLAEINRGAGRHQHRLFLFTGRYLYVPLVMVIVVIGFFF